MRLAELHRLAAALPAVIFILLPAAALGAGVQVSGTYVEARTADVYTGPCFANSEVGLVGKEAIMAWRIEEAAEKAASGARPMSGNRYKVQLARTATRRALGLAAGMEA